MKTKNKPLLCVCGHEKEVHKVFGSCYPDEWYCRCKQYRPAIPLSDLRALWEEVDLESAEWGALNHASLEEIFKRHVQNFERKLRALEKGVDK